MKDIGIWMSKPVLDHKRETDVFVQVWNLRRLPDGFIEEKYPGRLFVAVNGHWRGFFRLRPLLYNPDDLGCPYTLPFSPTSWTPILPQPAPVPNRAMGYTQELPRTDDPFIFTDLDRDNEME